MGGGTVQPGVGGNNQVGGGLIGLPTTGLPPIAINTPEPNGVAMSMQADGNTTGFRSKVPQALGSPPQNDVPPVSSVLDTGGAIPPQMGGSIPGTPTPGSVVTQPSIYNYSPEPGNPADYNSPEPGNPADYNDPEPGGHYYSPEPGGYGYNPEPGGGYSNQYYSEGGLIKDPLEGYDFKRGR